MTCRMCWDCVRTISRRGALLLAALLSWWMAGGLVPALAQTSLPGMPSARPPAAVSEAAPVSEIDQLHAEAERFRALTKQSQDAAAAYERAARATPSATKEVEAELAAPLPQLPEIKRDEEILRRFQAASEDLDAQRRQRANLDDEAAQRAERRQLAQGEASRARDRLYEVTAALALLSGEGAAATADAQRIAVDEARRAALTAERQYLETKLTELDREAQAYQAREGLLRLRKQLAERHILIAERKLAAFKDAIVEFRAAEIEQTWREAEARVAATASAHPAVRAVAEENLALSKELLEFLQLVPQVATDKLELDAKLAQVSKAFDTARERVTRIGMTETAGLHLSTLRLQLPDVRFHRQRLEQRRAELIRVQLRRVALEDQQIALIDVEREAAKRLAAYPGEMSARERKEVMAAVSAELKRQKDTFLAELLRAHDGYVGAALTPLDEAERQLLDITGAFRAFIDERILWIQSSPPVSFETILRGWDAVFWLIDPQSAQRILLSLWDDFRANPVMYIGATLLLLGLLAVEFKLHGEVRKLNELAGYRLRARFHQTIGVTVAIALTALSWAWLCWFVGSRLASLPSAGSGPAIGEGLMRVAVVLFAANVIIGVFRPRGLAEIHFGTDPEACRLVRVTTHWVLPFAVPLAFLVTAMDAQALDSYRDSLGRLAFIVGMMVGVVYLFRVFRPSNGVLRHFLAADSKGWLARLRYVWFGAMLLTPVALAVAAAAGYFFAAVHIERKLLNTAFLVLGLLFARQIMVRWVNLTQVRLAIDRVREKMAAARAAEGDSAGAPPVDITEAAIEKQAIDASVIDAQVRTLLNGSTVLGILFGTLLIWHDVLPAFNVLRQVELWTDLVPTVVGGNGAEALRTVQQAVPITLADVVLSLFIITVTVIVSKNIPGLLEIAVLQHLPITPGGRYAATTLVRYSIVILGLVVAVSAVGVSWSKIQWLVAAMTVGLAFGLQEIFANFVSGLIVLFERPVRVGDVVTIGEVSGTVSGISMRATTIVDWDRKEHLIPNKQFVTGVVINWSLSDTTLRITLPVGIAYGSDIALATRLLLEVADNHPKVLKDPAPNAFFLNFADSELNLELWVFVPTIADRFPVRHDLLQEIDRVFAAHHIEMAFPQRDLHLRSVAPEASAALRGAGSAPQPG